MSKVKFLNQAGDTIVEVMLATAILSTVMAGAFTLTNHATRLSQTANERTEVSNLVQREAELIRARYSQGAANFWANFGTTADKINYASGEKNVFCNSDSTPNVASGDQAKAFFMDDSLDLVKSYDVPGFPGVFSDAETGGFYSVWVEAVNRGAPTTTHTDFYIYACWDGIGGEGVQSSGLVMRLSK